MHIILSFKEVDYASGLAAWRHHVSGQNAAHSSIVGTNYIPTIRSHTPQCHTNPLCRDGSLL